MIDKYTNEARRALDEIESTLATLTKMARDIEPSLCTDTDLARIEIAASHLNDAEDMLAALCADNNEAQEVSDQFPFEAWDLMARRPVTVTGWNEHHDNRLNITPGGFSRPNHITSAFPAWYIRAQQAQADAADEAETMSDVRYGGCQ